MNPLLEKVLEDTAGLAGAAIAGWVASTVRLGRRFDALHASWRQKSAEMDRLVEAAEERLKVTFDELRRNNARTWKLQLDDLHADVDKLEKRFEDLARSSGSWSTEDEMSKVLDKIADLREDIGKIKGRLGMSTRSTIPPAKGATPPRFPPRPGR